MTSPVTILTALNGNMLTKTLRCVDGAWKKTDYDNCKWFDSTWADVGDIFELSELLTMLEPVNNTCVIRGKLINGKLSNKVLRRKDAYDGEEAYFEENKDGLNWVMIDFDKVPAPTGLKTPEQRLSYLVSTLPVWFHNVTYHFQWSTSAGLEGWDFLSAHLWFWLNDKWMDNVIIDRIRIENWDCDESTIRTVQPNYTAAPVFIGCTDPIGNRSGLVRGEMDCVDLPPFIRPKPQMVHGKPYKPTPSFETRLMEIGPRYHMPIQKAIAAYVGRHGWNTDTVELKQIIQARINEAPPGANPKETYKNDRYLDSSIRGAMTKYGNHEGRK